MSMWRKIFTNNLTWLVLGLLSFLIGRIVTGVPRSAAGLVEDKMLPFTFLALMNFIMGAYVRARYWETGMDKQLMMKAVQWCTIGFSVLLLGWLVKLLAF